MPSSKTTIGVIAKQWYMNIYLFTEYLINIQKDIQKLYVVYIKNILITTILNI